MRVNFCRNRSFYSWFLGWKKWNLLSFDHWFLSWFSDHVYKNAHKKLGMRSFSKPFTDNSLSRALTTLTPISPTPSPRRYCQCQATLNISICVHWPLIDVFSVAWHWPCRRGDGVGEIGVSVVSAPVDSLTIVQWQFFSIFAELAHL